ncbi:MAG: aldo/keto reductase [Magnetococcales bacterium]|nr:aldo/keto reductase [Magnetococcales bacterium]
MRMRSLGTTGITVSEVGFGAWGIGGWTAGQISYGSTSDATSLAALDRAIELGYRLIDTAPLYGLGHSEVLVGQAIRGRRDKVVLATKAGYRSYDTAPDYSPAAIEQSLMASLKRLQVDHVDILQLHSPPIALLEQQPEIVECLQGLRQRGLIRTFGLSASSPADAEVAIRVLGFPVVQANFNMLDTRAVSGGLFAAARKGGAGVIARTPLCSGFLSGTMTAETVFPEGDHRCRWNGPQIRRWVEAANHVLALAAAGPGQAAESALRFVLSFPDVSVVIPGIMTPAEAEQNGRAGAAGPLPEAVIEKILLYNQGYDGPGASSGA